MEISSKKCKILIAVILVAVYLCFMLPLTFSFIGQTLLNDDGVYVFVTFELALFDAIITGLIIVLLIGIIFIYDIAKWFESTKFGKWLFNA